jgi:hypothetical protein
MVIPAEIAVVAMLGAIYYGYHAVADAQEEPAKPAASSSATPSAEPTAPPKVKTTRLVSKKGGFAVGVPESVTAKKIGPAVSMTTADKTLNVAIGAVAPATLSATSAALMRDVKNTYTKVRVTRTQTDEVDGHKARATYARARNAEKLQITFVHVVVKSKTRNYVISAFTAADSDPLFVVPRVNAIIDTFEVIK